MVFLYNIGIAFYRLVAMLISPFNNKANLWYSGRKNWQSNISSKIRPTDKPIWVHCSSLGEFEQGRPIIEAIKKQNAQQKIVLTFFSPSGYEIRKNYQGADYVFYLPIDTHRNAAKFIKLVNPSAAIFVKYEFWYHYLHLLKKKNIPTYIVSAIFRPQQPFFKFYGGWYRKFLNNFTHLFVQDENSKQLLQGIGINNVTVAGDTRFDRVLKIAEEAKCLPIVESFCAAKRIIVAGSTWPKDEDILQAYFNVPNPDLKLVIAPHEVHESHINEIIAKFGAANCVRYTQAKIESVESAKILIIDTIGILSSAYKYAQLAYIGGGFGVGIHNTLEAAAYGIPVVFGPNYKHFREAVELIKFGAGFTVANADELKNIFDELLTNADFLTQSASSAKNYVLTGKGSSEKILSVIL